VRVAAPKSILFVCLGNICRSPLAEGVFSEVARTAGRRGDFRLDSAGTGAWHPAMAAAFNITTADRIMFGTDYPLE
jgi:protein-tyrosine phosphatase